MFISNPFVQNHSATPYASRHNNVFQGELRWRGLSEYIPPRKLTRPLTSGRKLHFAMTLSLCQDVLNLIKIIPFHMIRVKIILVQKLYLLIKK
jgi:hypothetical protein